MTFSEPDFKDEFGMNEGCTNIPGIGDIYDSSARGFFFCPCSVCSFAGFKKAPFVLGITMDSL
jgi:hypothetical protein